MHFNKENYLSVSYQANKGLILNWNFTDLHQIHNYYHHLFIIAHHQSKNTQSLIEHYYKKMKLGDLIAIVYYHDVKGLKTMTWLEKTQHSSLQLAKIFKSLTKTALTGDKIQQIFKCAGEITRENSNSNVVSNFILSEEFKEKGDMLTSKIEKYRQQGAFLYHCTFFNVSPFNRICFNSGVHFLNTDTIDFQQVISFYHSIINNAALKMAKISIECKNGQMMSYDAQVWHNTDFNRIERSFYGPSINYEDDTIQFHLLDTCEDIEFDMTIKLELKLFSGQTIIGNKKMKLAFLNERFFDKSLNLAIYEPLISMGGIEVKSNPYSTMTFVRLMKSVYQDLGQLKEKMESTIKERRTRQQTARFQKVEKVQKLQKGEKDSRQNTRRRPIQYFIPHKEQNDQQFSA